MKRAFTRPPAIRWTSNAIAVLAVLFVATLAFQVSGAAPVPDFTLQLLDGKTTSLQEHRGSPVLINFFHSK